LAQGQLLLLERRKASAEGPGSLGLQVARRILVTLVGSAGGGAALLSQNGEDLGDALAEQSDVLEVDLCLGRHLLHTQLGKFFLFTVSIARGALTRSLLSLSTSSASESFLSSWTFTFCILRDLINNKTTSPICVNSTLS
jgi:hypothetical protein